MDNNNLLDEYKGKVVKSMNLIGDYQLQILFEDNSEIEVIHVDSALQVNCDVRIKKTL